MSGPNGPPSDTGPAAGPILGGALLLASDADMKIALSTPPEWRVLNLERLENVSWARPEIAAHLPAGNEEVAAQLAEMAHGAAAAGIVFAAMCVPGDGESADLSVVTLALRQRADRSSRGEVAAPRGVTGGEASEDGSNRSESEGDAVVLPAGPAVREAALETFEAPPLGPMPVFTVEYALAVPGDERVAVLAFITIAPSDIHSLGVQFAEIAATLSFH